MVFSGWENVWGFRNRPTLFLEDVEEAGDPAAVKRTGFQLHSHCFVFVTQEVDLPVERTQSASQNDRQKLISLQNHRRARARRHGHRVQSRGYEARPNRGD